MILDSAIEKIKDRQSLTVEETRETFDAIFEGGLPAEQIGELLLRMHKRHETVEEIYGATLSMRGKMKAIRAPDNAIDIVGTGGDGLRTFNISTATALVVAGCDVPVAKHGNRAATSKSGSSDVLAALGVNLEPPLERLEECLHEAGICFLFAPRHHPAMRHVADIRHKLGVRTIFNLLGPLTNPANVSRHLIGVYTDEWLKPMAKVLHMLASRAAWLTHGHDGMDELTITGDSDVVALARGAIGEFTLSPEKAGLDRTSIDGLLGGNAAENAAAMTRLLDGEKGPYRDIVLLNAGAALVVAGLVNEIKPGVLKAAEALDSGAARDRLQKLVEVTNS
jgi:anthranilate phosphoribosyltransferase